MFKDKKKMPKGIIDGPFVQQSKTICVILVQGIRRNNSLKFF